MRTLQGPLAFHHGSEATRQASPPTSSSLAPLEPQGVRGRPEIPDSAGLLVARAQAAWAPLKTGTRRFRRIGLPVLLLLISILTTTANGARFARNFALGLPAGLRDSDLWPWPWLLHHPHLFVTGFAFSSALLTILLVHEFGHYFACRIHHIRATLPFVLPAPTLSGTAGAVIQIRSGFMSRDALMDVGIYGPLVGYLASLVALAVGFRLSRPASFPIQADLGRFGPEPLTMRLIHALLAQAHPSLPAFHDLSPHPVLLAGWIGLFITSLNLIPGGQLDGGHILYALSPRAHRIVTRILPCVLFLAGTFYWAGWILWGLILLIPAMRHPRVPENPPFHPGRKVLGVVGLILFVLTFTPSPFADNSLIDIISAIRAAL